MKRVRWALILLAATTAVAQQPNEKSGPHPYQVKPDFENVPYGPHERNVLDFWKAKSDHPTPLILNIHGGGFVHGDKTSVPIVMLRYHGEHGISANPMNYRSSTQAPYQ